MIENANIIALPPVDWGGGDLRDVVLVEITSPDGFKGLGTGYANVQQAREAWSCYQQDPESLHKPDETLAGPMSAIDLALWDIRGKTAGLPVSELLGGRKRDRVLAYATVDLPMTNAVRGDAFDTTLRSFLDQGFKAIKLCIENFGHRGKAISDKEWDLREAGLLRFARKIAGKDIQLMLDVYGSDPDWPGNFEWALKTTRILEEQDYFWFEEPLAPRAFEDFARLTRETNIAISGGEDFVLSRDFERAAKLGAVNILQPDCTRVGGLTKMQSIRNIASQHGLQVIPHGWITAVGLAADLHFQSAAPNDHYSMVEYGPHRLVTDLLKHHPFALDDEGKMAVPEGPGLGIELKHGFKRAAS